MKWLEQLFCSPHIYKEIHRILLRNSEEFIWWYNLSFLDYEHYAVYYECVKCGHTIVEEKKVPVGIH